MNNTSDLWERNIVSLSDNLLDGDFNKFLHWDVIRRTMFVGNNAFAGVELFYLVTHNWNLWRHAIKEDDLGAPTPFILRPSSSGNLIHHAHHLAKFMTTTKTDVRDYDTIFEFGGGYGSMARLFHNIGFGGEYVIYDLPIFSFLQECYLKTIGKYGGVTCISDIADLPKDTGRTLFIGTWSLSEVPVKFRDEVIAAVCPDSYLITYQESFDGIDNCAYFNSMSQRKSATEWHSIKIKQMADKHYYLFGGDGGNK